MSRATVRQAAAAWLSSNVPGLSTVYPALPRVIPAAAFTAGQVGASYGCVAVVHIPSDREQRIALGGAHAGWKRSDHTVEIQLFLRWTARPTNTSEDSAVLAMDALDAITEAIKTRIRADRTANGLVWQWGEQGFAGRYGEPIERGDAVEVWASITTQVTEMIPT